MNASTKNNSSFSARNQRAGGFTVIELVVVIAIIGFLMAILSVVFVNYTASARIKQTNALIRKLSIALQSYYSDCGRVFPPDTGYGLSMVGGQAGVTYDPGSLWRYLGKAVVFHKSATDAGVTYGPYLTFGDRELVAYTDPVNGQSFYVCDAWRRPLGYVGDPRRVIHKRGEFDLYSAGPDGKTASDRKTQANNAYNNLDDDADGIVDNAPELGDTQFNGTLTTVQKCQGTEKPDDINNWESMN
jgi:prepilin-type N-terminal cleavage/methylation domain-containing protein